MENAGFNFGEIEIIAVPKGICAASVKKCSPAVALLGHDVGVGGGSFGGGAEVADVDFVVAAIVEDLFAEGIFADEARAKEWKWRAGFGEVDQNVVRSAAGALGLAADIAELLWLRIDIDQFDLVDDPVPTREKPAMGI